MWSPNMNLSFLFLSLEKPFLPRTSATRLKQHCCLFDLFAQRWWKCPSQFRKAGLTAAEFFEWAFLIVQFPWIQQTYFRAGLTILTAL